MAGEFDTSLLETFDPRTVDDPYLIALAREYRAIERANPEFDLSLKLSRQYDEGMGIIPSNSFHLWFDDRPINPEEPFSLVNNINNSMFASWPGVQGLILLRKLEPDLFEEVNRLSDENNTAMCRIIENTRETIKHSDKEAEDLIIQALVCGWKLNLAKTKAIKWLRDHGVSDDSLSYLYR